MGILEFIGSLFDNSSSSASTEISSWSGGESTMSSHISSGSDWSPSANDAFGTAAGDFQCASEASSAFPSFEATTDTWGSINS